MRRFGQDIQRVDRELPLALSSFSNRKCLELATLDSANPSPEIFKLAVQVTLLFSVQKLMAITLPICAAVVYAIQKIYLRVSKELRLLELESISSVYSSFLETVSNYK